MNILAYLKQRSMWQTPRAISVAHATLLLLFCANAFASLSCDIPTAAAAQFSEASRGASAPASSSASPRAASDNPQTNSPADTIGVIEGEAIAVSGPMSVQVVHGQ